MGSKKRKNETVEQTLLSAQESKTQTGVSAQATTQSSKTQRGGSALRKRIAVIAAILVVLAAASFFFLRNRRLPFVAGGDPDIILVTIDTLRVDGVSFTGSKRVKTPYIDELARGGVYFSNAHAHNVVTFPSHSNILTGLLPYEHGVRDNAGFTLDPKHKTVAYYLKDKGYVSGAFVAAFPLDARFGLGVDFETYDDKYREGSKPTQFSVPERPASEVFAAARQWYDAAAGKKRFMWVHVYEPHMPYAPPSPWREQYKDEPYYGEVAATDDALQQFLAPILEQNPNTMVILTADHGEGQGEHGEFTHSVFAYEETLHVPMLVYEKGRIKPRVEKGYVGHIDIVPTILERVGIKKPAALKGESLLKIEKPRDTYFEALSSNLNLGWAPLVGVIHEGHKYIDLPIAELYDLAADPKEKKNILEENRRMTTRIRGLLAANAPKPDADKMNRNLSQEEAQNLLSLGYLAGTAQTKKVYTEADDPKNVVHLYMAMMKAVETYQKGDLAEALRLARGLIAERPDMGMARDTLAFLLQQSENPEEAERVIRDAMQKGLATDAMRKRLGMILSETGRAAEAVEILAPFATSNDPDLLNAYGIALADTGKIREAISQFERALVIDKTNATSYQNLGIVALRIGDLQRAEAYLNRALQLNQEMPLALNTMGVLHARKNDLPRAVESWKRAVALDPKQYDALFNIGLVSARTGRREDAKRALAQFVQTAPKARYAADIASARQALTALQ
jgi:arylsulfatase A-like enzyme/Flp pilus assembly protein TadD